MADTKPNPCIVKWNLFTCYLNSPPFGRAGSTPFGRAIRQLKIFKAQCWRATLADCHPGLPHVATTADKASLPSVPQEKPEKVPSCPQRMCLHRIRPFHFGLHASPIWDPHLKKDINAHETVNRRATRYVIGDYHLISRVSGMLPCSLAWSNLEDRGKEAHLTLCHKLVKGEILVLSEDINLKLADHQRRSSHKFRYKTKSASTSNLSNFVTHKTIKDWNSLPAYRWWMRTQAVASSLALHIWAHAPSLSPHRYFIYSLRRPTNYL